MSQELCPKFNDCPFASRTKLSTALMTLKEIYCLGDPLKCEILKRFLSGKVIPKKMLPDGMIET